MAQSTAPVTVTSTLESIWADVGSPVTIAALSSVAPWVGAMFKIPVLGPFLTWCINSLVNKLIVAGVIEVKIGILAFMSQQAQSKWADELKVLNDVAAAGKTLTPEQQADYDSALQGIVKSRSGVVRA